MTGLAFLRQLVIESQIYNHNRAVLATFPRFNGSNCHNDDLLANKQKTSEADTLVQDKKDDQTTNNRSNILTEVDELAEPNSCCMSGCSNCVWIEYAEKLSELLGASEEDIQKKIMEKVNDPNMRAFLSMELRARKSDK